MKSILYALLMLLCLPIKGQTPWDDERTAAWPDHFQLIQIPSTLDGEMQPAFFYVPDSASLRPLIVSLHTWSGGFSQADPLAAQAVSKGYIYIRPHFRGPNNTPKACGSPFAIQDIDDAITFALENARVDTSQIHMIGTSGGGYATLLAYMRSAHHIRSFSAWVPISNLEDWYYESLGRGNKYAGHILAATSGGEPPLNVAEARARSPYYMTPPLEKRAGSTLHVFAGVHDGYRGSVPITHSLHFYNKVVRDWAPDQSEALIPVEDILSLVAKRHHPAGPFGQIGDRDIHLSRSFKDRVHLCIFEGKHECLMEVALDHIQP